MQDCGSAKHGAIRRHSIQRLLNLMHKYYILLMMHYILRGEMHG